jgi:hypothetical protein
VNDNLGGAIRLQFGEPSLNGMQRNIPAPDVELFVFPWLSYVNDDDLLMGIKSLFEFRYGDGRHWLSLTKRVNPTRWCLSSKSWMMYIPLRSWETSMRY